MADGRLGCLGGMGGVDEQRMRAVGGVLEGSMLWRLLRISNLVKWGTSSIAYGRCGRMV